MWNPVELLAQLTWKEFLLGIMLSISLFIGIIAIGENTKPAPCTDVFEAGSIHTHKLNGQDYLAIENWRTICGRVNMRSKDGRLYSFYTWEFK